MCRPTSGPPLIRVGRIAETDDVAERPHFSGNSVQYCHRCGWWIIRPFHVKRKGRRNIGEASSVGAPPSKLQRAYLNLFRPCTPLIFHLDADEITATVPAAPATARPSTLPHGNRHFDGFRNVLCADRRELGSVPPRADWVFEKSHYHRGDRSKPPTHCARVDGAMSQHPVVMRGIVAPPKTRCSYPAAGVLCSNKKLEMWNGRDARRTPASSRHRVKRNFGERPVCPHILFPHFFHYPSPQYRQYLSFSNNSLRARD